MDDNDKKSARIMYESLPEDMQEFLKNILKESKSDKDFLRIMMVGDCPKCGSENTRDCEDAPLGDPTVGICLDCYTMGCLECEEVFGEGQTVCKHWNICEECEFISDEGCGIPILECSTIQDWKDGKFH